MSPRRCEAGSGTSTGQHCNEYAPPHDDLPVYAAEGIEVIASALAVGAEDELLNAYLAAYLSGRLPLGDEKPIPGSLAELLPPDDPDSG